MWHSQKYEDAPVLLRRLIANITNIREGTERFQRLEDHAIHELRAADSMVFVSKKDLDATMSSFCDKFIFHGFCTQAKDLREAYECFIPPNLSKEETDHKIITMRLLLSLSESPTKIFSILPQGSSPVVDEELIDWPTYLMQGVERWSPPIDESSSESWSDDSRSCGSSGSDCDNEEAIREVFVASQDKSLAGDVLQEFIDTREALSGCVQNTWFNQEHVYMLPASTNVDARITVHWDDFLHHYTKGLVKLSKSNIITEYKVMREILWQLWEPHTSFVFEIVGNDLQPRTGIALSSVRSEPFEKFLHEFLPYVKLLQSFRDFHASLTPKGDEVIPETYRSYDSALHDNIIDPIYKGLLQLEEEVMAQETIMSVLQLADRLRKLFKNAQIIQATHQRIVSDLEGNSPVHSATTLLSRLHTGLLHCTNKNEQDIYLSIYLESLYKYFSVIQSWLSQDALIDLSGEFIIVDGNERGLHPDWLTDETPRTDNVLKTIATEVLQIGKNIHLLRLLRKLHLLKDSASLMTLHEELIIGVLREIAEYFEAADWDLQPGSKDPVVSIKFPMICPDDCKYPTEMDRLENLVDTSDGFLMNAFASYFTDVEEAPNPKGPTLYERISNMTKTVFPATQIIDSVFRQILQARYSEAGYMVKNLLTDEYHIEKHLRLLQHVYLFKDDIICLLYRRVFEQIELNSWDSEVWLTNQLHDTLANIHPDFCENCFVKLKESSLLPHDPLQVCSRLTIEYKIDWPTNIIIRNEHMVMYAELFHVILQIKWGLYTLNHLYFNEIEPKRKPQEQCKILRDVITKLKVLRFCLLNEFSSIQHYILGYIYNKHITKFQEEFEGAYNLDTLIASHDDFINGMYTMITGFRDFNESTYGFDLLLHLVRKLSVMWIDLKSINYEELKSCESMYRKCHEYLNPIMYPKDICFDYN